MAEARSAVGLAALLRTRGRPDEQAKVRSRLQPDEAAIGMRMGDLFTVARAHRDLPLGEVDRLLDEPEYEVRMAAFCILDFKARRPVDDRERRALYDLYLDRHDRITTWDMVDRAAPRVVGGHLAGGSVEPLHDLARADEPLRRRTAITAPLFFVKAGSATDLEAGFAVAGLLATDADPTVHRAVGIFLKHAGARDGPTLTAFLDRHAPAMPRPALRLAVEKLPGPTRTAYLAIAPSDR